MNTTDLMQMKNDNATKEVIEQSPKQLLNDFLYSIYYSIISVKQQRHWHKHLKKVYHGFVKLALWMADNVYI